MKTVIKDTKKWEVCFRLSGTTATGWLDQVLRSKRETDLKYSDFMKRFKVRNWTREEYFACVDKFGLKKAHHLLVAKLAEDARWLAGELDRRLHELTAVETERNITLERERAAQIVMSSGEVNSGCDLKPELQAIHPAFKFREMVTHAADLSARGMIVAFMVQADNHSYQVQWGIEKCEWHLDFELVHLTEDPKPIGFCPKKPSVLGEPLDIQD